MTKKTLFYNGYVVTENPKDEIYKKGWVLIEDDKIAGVGEGDAPAFLDDDVTKRDISGCVIMPGFVNMHTHVTGSIYRGLTESMVGSLYKIVFATERLLTEETAYHINILGSIEAVKYGSTFMNDMNIFPNQIANAFLEVGLRGTVCGHIYDPNFNNLQFNDYTTVPGQGEKKFQENLDFINKYNGAGNGRIEGGFGLHATDTVTLPLAKEVAACAKEIDAPVCIHVAQKMQEVNHVVETYGITPVEYLLESGLADGRLTAAHCVQISDKDAKILGENKIPVAHCPEVFFKGGGFTPVKRWYDNNVTFGLGTDSVTLNPWSNLRTYLGTWRTIGDYTEEEITARMAFRKATIGAAELLGKDDVIGSLEKGKKADFFVMNIDKTYIKPVFDYDILSTIIWNANGSEVETVWIDGNPVVEEGEMVTINEKEAIAKSDKVCHDLLDGVLAAL